MSIGYLRDLNQNQWRPYMAANVENMAYFGETPWHGLGKSIDHAMTSEEALCESGLDWDVIPTPVMVNGNELADYIANVRSTDGAILGMVSPKYKIVQNKEAFAFVDDILKSNAGVRFETAGSLNGGKRVFMLANLPPTRILDDDIVPYLCFTQGHDGKHPISVMRTDIRTVCVNTVNLALRTARRSWSFRHMGNLEYRKRDASETLLLANQYTIGLREFAEEATKKKIGVAQLDQIMSIVFPDDEDASDRIRNNVATFRNQFMDIYTNKDDLQSIRGTAWGVINAASDFASHVKPLRKTDQFQERLFTSFLDGNKVLDRITELAMVA